MGSIQNILLSYGISRERWDLYTTSYYPMEYQGRDGIYTQHLIIPWNIKVEMGSKHNILLSHGISRVRWDLYSTQHLIIPWNIKGEMGSIHNILLSHGISWERWNLYIHNILISIGISRAMTTLWKRTGDCLLLQSC